MNYILPPFNYTGSKYRLLAQLIPEFDTTRRMFVDLFSGGGSVWTNILHLYDLVMANDIIGELIGIQRALLESDDIIEQVKTLAVNKEDQAGYHDLRDSFNREKTAPKLWALILCCTNNMMRFNRRLLFNQTFGKRSFNKQTLEKTKLFTAHIRAYREKIVFSSKDFTQVDIKIPAFFYIDPPYSNTEAGYNSYWGPADDLMLADYCKNLHERGQTFCVSGSLNHAGEKCRLLEELIKTGFCYKELVCDYNKVSRRGKKETVEIIVKNF